MIFSRLGHRFFHNNEKWFRFLWWCKSIPERVRIKDRLTCALRGYVSLSGKGCRYWFFWWFAVTSTLWWWWWSVRSIFARFSKWDLLSSSLCQQKVILISICAWVKSELRLTPNLRFRPSCNIICVISFVPRRKAEVSGVKSRGKFTKKTSERLEF